MFPIRVLPRLDGFQFQEIGSAEHLLAEAPAFEFSSVAVSATFLANTWANARITMRVDRPRWSQAFLLYLGSLALTSAALLVVDTLGGGVVAQVIALLVTWTVAAFGRLVLMSREQVAGKGAR
jgi:hypothetical protein